MNKDFDCRSIGSWCRRLVTMGLVLHAMALTGGAQERDALEAQARPFAAKFLRPERGHPAQVNAASEDQVRLGKTLFFEPRLSDTEKVSCATCHDPALVWQDGRAVGIGSGMKEMSRRTPPILNLAWGGPYTWDGRAETLEGQALGPIASPAVMNLPLDQMIAKLRGIAGYAPLFERAYPGEGITPAVVGKAIAAFERSVVAGPSAFDRWAAGNPAALKDSAKRGFILFNTKAGCDGCHAGWRFTDDGFYDIGVPGSDKGRGNIVRAMPALEYAFKTPTLSNVAERPPYMHNGSLPTLEAVVDHYNRGGGVSRPTLAPGVRPLNLRNSERADLAAFLRALSDQADPLEPPRLPQ